MLSLLLSLVALASTSAANPNCSLTSLLRTAKPDPDCVKAYLARIPNEEDRAEAYSSDNPSFARRLQNAMKAQRNAALDLVLPSAYADQPELKRRLLTLYGVEQAQGDAETLIKGGRLSKFLPDWTWLGKFLPETYRCTKGNLLEKTTYADDTAGYGLRDLEIAPQSPREFLVQGLKPPTTHRLRLANLDQNAIIDAKNPGAGLEIETCANPSCTKFTGPEKLDQWNIVLGLNPSEEAEDAKVRHLDPGLVNKKNMDYREKLANRLITLSILGECCGNEICKQELLKRHNIKLQDPPSSPTTAQ